MSAGSLIGCGGGSKSPAVVAQPEAAVRQPEPPATAAIPDYATKLAEWVEAHQTHPQAQNRWPLFVDTAARMAGAWELFTLTDGPIAAFIQENPDKNWAAADPLVIVNDAASARFIPELRKFFDALGKTKILFHMDEVAAPSRFVALRATEPLMYTDTPELGEARLAVKLCAARVRVMLDDQRPEEAVRSLGHALAIARAVQGRGTLIAHLVGVACWTTAAREIATGVLDGRIDGGTAKEMLELLREGPPDARVAFGGERCFTLETLERFFEKVKAEAEATQGRELSPVQQRAIDGGVGVLASREEQITEANRFFDACQLLFGADAAERARGQAEVDAVFARIGSVGERKDGAKSYMPLATTLPAIGAAVKSAQRGTMVHAGTRTMLALEVFRARTRKYPQTLEELTPADLDALPVDPFAGAAGNGDGAPLRYRLLDAEAATAASGYALYSVGSDGEDNGGKPHPTNPANATGPTGRGFDAIINARAW